MRRALIVLAILLTSCGQVDLGQAIQQLQPAVAPAVTSEATADAVKQVIERANEAQQKAFATGDTTLMRETATASYYDELTQINTDLARGGVTGFSLVRIEWGDVTITGATAEATAYETWRTTYGDGSQDQRTDRNDYTLVLDGGAWKIQADVQRRDIWTRRRAGADAAGHHDHDTGQDLGHVEQLVGLRRERRHVHVGHRHMGRPAGRSDDDRRGRDVGRHRRRDRDRSHPGRYAGDGDGRRLRHVLSVDRDPPGLLAHHAAPGHGRRHGHRDDHRADERAVADRDGEQHHERLYEKTLRYASSRSSAEWVQEAPSTSRGIVPLDDFGTVRFIAGSAVRDGVNLGLSALGATPVAMINRAGQAIALPSTLGADGSSFVVTRTSAPGSVQGGGRASAAGDSPPGIVAPCAWHAPTGGIALIVCAVARIRIRDARTRPGGCHVRSERAPVVFIATLVLLLAVGQSATAGPNDRKPPKPSPTPTPAPISQPRPPTDLRITALTSYSVSLSVDGRDEQRRDPGIPARHGQQLRTSAR